MTGRGIDQIMAHPNTPEIAGRVLIFSMGTESRAVRIFKSFGALVVYQRTGALLQRNQVFGYLKI